MAVANDGVVATQQIVSTSGIPAVTSSMCVAVHFRIDSDVDRLAGILMLARYLTDATAHVLVVDSSGTGLQLLSNYLDNTPTSVVKTLSVGTSYTAFIEGNGSTLTLSAIEEGDDTIDSASTTQDAFAPDRMFLLDTDSGTNESANASMRWIRVWNATLSAAEKLIEHTSTTAKKAGVVAAYHFIGEDLDDALDNGSGAEFSYTSGITYSTWGEGESVATLIGSADINLDTPDSGASDVAPTITTASLATGQAGVAYSQQIASTGTAPIEYSAVGLPSGMSISPAGLISGTTALTGPFSVEITATNTAGSDVAQFTLQVANPAVPKPVITTSILPTGQEGVAYAGTLAVSGAGPFTWTFNGLWPGAVLDGGSISGTPTHSGVYALRVRVTGAGGTSDEVVIQVLINPEAEAVEYQSSWARSIKR